MAHRNDSSRWFAISSPPPICCSVSILSMGLQKSKELYKLGCENYFCRVAYWAPLEMLSVSRKQPELVLGIIDSREFLEIQYNTLDLLLCFSWSSQYMHFTPLPPALTDQNYCSFQNYIATKHEENNLNKYWVIIESIEIHYNTLDLLLCFSWRQCLFQPAVTDQNYCSIKVILSVKTTIWTSLYTVVQGQLQHMSVE